MVAHVDLAWDDACLRPHEVARTVRTASAWQVRQPVYRRSAGRAQRYERFLGPLREALDGVAGGLMRGRRPGLANAANHRACNGQKEKSPFPEREEAFSGRSGPSREAFRTWSGSVERHAHPDNHQIDILHAVLRHLPPAGVCSGAAAQAVPDADAPERAVGAGRLASLVDDPDAAVAVDMIQLEVLVLVTRRLVVLAPGGRDARPLTDDRRPRPTAVPSRTTHIASLVRTPIAAVAIMIVHASTYWYSSV